MDHEVTVGGGGREHSFGCLAKRVGVSPAQTGDLSLTPLLLCVPGIGGGPLRWGAQARSAELTKHRPEYAGHILVYSAHVQ